MAVAQLDTDDHHPENGFVSPAEGGCGARDPSELLARIDGSVLPFLGGFGKYQKQLIVLTWIPALFIGFSQHSDNFLLAQPNNTCVTPPANLTRSYNNHQNNNHSGGTGSSPVPGSNTSSASLPASLYANGSTGAAGGAGGAGGGGHNESDSMRCRCSEWTFELHTGLVQNVVTKWSLVCDSAWKVHIAKFSLLVGSIFGYLVFGILADWFGRHPVLIISVLFMLVFGLTVAFSVNVPMFSTLRFFEGFCLAGISLSLYTLRIELCLPHWRFSMTMVANFVMLGGQLLMPGVAYLCRDWQVLQAVIICPLLLMLSYIWIFPESLRWLLATQQYCRSKWIMGHIAKKNRVNMELDADNILTELQKALQKKPKKTCIVKMVGTRNLWKNIVVLCVNSLTGYGIHHCFARSMMDHDAQETTMFHNFYADYFTMAGIAVASCIALCPAVGLMGRRGGLLMFMIITALASLLQLGLLNLLGKYSVQLNIDSSDTLKKNFSIAFSIIGMFSSHAVSNLSIFFCAEITPTVIRGGGLGLVLASAGFGMLTAPIMELHNQKGYFLHHIIFACCTLICIICILLLPETRYQPLPETLADGESYTRQPLLPPRKPGEQRLLLPQSESSRDYTRVHDTPLHETAATVASTMDSTASSAIDLTAAADMLGAGFMEMHPAKHKDPNGHSMAAVVASRDGVIRASKDHLLSSTPLHKAAPSVTDPLLADAGEPTTVVLESIRPVVVAAASLPEMNDAVESPFNDPETTSLGSAPPPAPPPPMQTVPASQLICTTPIIEPPPTSTLESPEPPGAAIETPADSPTPSPYDSPAPSPTPRVDCDSAPSPSPPPVADCDSAPPPVIVSDSAPPPVAVCDIAPPPAVVSDSAPPPVAACDSAPPPAVVSDSAPPPVAACDSAPPPAVVSDSAPPPVAACDSAPPPSPPHTVIPVHIELVDESTSTPSQLDSDLKDPPPSSSPSSFSPPPPPPPSEDSSPLPPPSSSILPVTDIVTSPPEPAVPLTEPLPLVLDCVPTSGTDSGVAEVNPAPSLLLDCTVSSPIDSGVLPVVSHPENGAVNGTDSS